MLVDFHLWWHVLLTSFFKNHPLPPKKIEGRTFVNTARKFAKNYLSVSRQLRRFEIPKLSYAKVVLRVFRISVKLSFKFFYWVRSPESIFLIVKKKSILSLVDLLWSKKSRWSWSFVEQFLKIEHGNNIRFHPTGNSTLLKQKSLTTSLCTVRKFNRLYTNYMT